MTQMVVNRRGFLVSVGAVGAALTLGFRIPSGEAEAAAPEINAWIVIHPDDTVVIRVARSEMGQGVFTALPMLVAEELECDWSKVRPEYAAPEDNFQRRRVFGDMSTGGSRSVRGSHHYLRQAGATGREMLIAAAAARWNVPASECRARASVVTHMPSGRTLRYGEVAQGAAAIKPPAKIALKDPKDWTLLGTPQKRVDVIDKVLGKPIYAIDVKLPGMLHAAIAQSPVFKGSVKTVDESKLAGIRGVRRVVNLGNAVAVVADSWWQAKKGLDALSIAWDEGDNGHVSDATITQFLRTGFTADDAGVGREEGNVAAGFARAAKRIEAEYAVPFLAHATLEPQTCTAHVTADKVEIWVPTQNGEAALGAAAAASGLPPSKVVVHKTMLGGGFGRRGAFHDYVVQAVRIAKAMERPVKLVWSREEDMQHGFYRPVVMARLVAGLDADGLPVAWQVRLSGHSILGSLFPERASGTDRHFQEGFLEDMPYAVPNYLVDYAMRNTHVPVGFWRAVNQTQNTFFKECFVDEMAHAAGQDPYDYRRKLLANSPKFLAVLDAAAKRAGWGSPLPAGVHRGIALNKGNNSICASVIEASVGSSGEVRVHRVVSAIDCGHVVNPLTIEQQTESCVVYGLTAALYGEINIKDGRVVQSNFHDYRMMRMAEMPKVETVLVPSGGFWGGVGEPGVAAIAPALCNAIFAATGKRIRSLPLKNHDLRAA